MNKKNLLLILPLLAVVTSCGPTSNGNTDLSKVIDNLLNNVNVSIEGNETITFDEGYEFLNSTNEIKVNRDYSKIVEEDGSLTPAIRDNTNNAFKTYFRAKDGGTVYEILNPDNTVQECEYRINYNKVLFNERFSNPFEYIDETDIDENGNLSLVKANLVVDYYTGLLTSPKSAKFTFDGNKATSLKIEFNPRYDLIETSSTFILGVANYDLDINFAYDVVPLTHLTPRSGADEHITNALTNKNNYTVTFEIDINTAKSTTFVTENAIFVQNNIDSVGPTDGDKFYKKVGENTYESYIYKASAGKFNIDELSVNISKIIPDISTVNPNIFKKESGKNYVIDSIAAPNSLDNFVVPQFIIGDGYGTNGIVKLDENDNISQYRGTYYFETYFTVTQNYSNYGSTTLPSWLDVDNIK